MKLEPNDLIIQFNKLTHNCASWSVFGVVGDQDMSVHTDEEAYGLELDSILLTKTMMLQKLFYWH